MDRSKFIGGSDAAGVLGLSRWETPLSIWAKKTGQYIPPEVDNEAAELGKELEDYVAKRFARKTGKNLVRAGDTVYLKEYDFLGANIDRIIEGEAAGFEAKTCSAWKSKEWEGEEIPQEYIIQCYHYMMVTGLRKWYIAVLIGNQDFKWKEILWDDKIIADIQRREVDFWEKFVIPNIMPTAITKLDAPTLEGLFPEGVEGKIITLPDEANIHVENLTALKQDLKSVEGHIDLVENQLKALLKDAEAGETALYKVAWKNIKIRRFDLANFEIAYPDLVKQFKPEKISRRFGYKTIVNKEK